MFTGTLAVVLWSFLDDWWPWVLALGILVVAALIGVRRPGALAVGLAVADVWWLLSIPLWGWSLTFGGLAFGAGLWWSWKYRKARAAPAAAPAAQGSQLIPPESPTEITAPIPRLTFPRTSRIQIFGLAGRPVARWQPITALVVGVALLALGIVGWRLDAAADARRQQAERQALHEQSVAKILPRTGVDVVWGIARAISSRDPRVICFAFTPPAARDFAQAHGADLCENAIMLLAGQVPSGRAYENAVTVMPLASNAVTYVSSTRMVVDACAVKVNPPTAGPSRLGIFTLDSRYGEGSQITAYTRC